MITAHRSPPAGGRRFRRLAHLAGALALLLLPGTGWAMPRGDYAHPEVLLQPEELKALLDGGTPNLRIIDFRHKAKYYLGHVPGAIQIWRPDIEDGGHRLPNMPASAAQVERLLGRLGIASQDTLVLYSDQCDHTRLWWLLACYGYPLDRLKLLDGGLDAWKSRGYPTHLTGPALPSAVFRFPSEGGRPSLMATLDEVKETRGEPSKVIVDVRPLQLYLGEEGKEGAPRHGHIPGAIWVFWQEARVANGPGKGLLRRAEEIKNSYEEHGITPDQDIYLYGHTGICAAYSLVSLYLAGYPLEKLHLYAGSWIEWSRSKEPVALGMER